MLGQKRYCPLPGELGGLGVVAGALVAMKAVLRFGLDVDSAIAPAFLFDHFDVAHRDRGILLAEMHLRRYFRFFIRVFGDLAAVIADRGREAAEPARGEERDGAAHAETY